MARIFAYRQLKVGAIGVADGDYIQSFTPIVASATSQATTEMPADTAYIRLENEGVAISYRTNTAAVGSDPSIAATADFEHIQMIAGDTLNIILTT